MPWPSLREPSPPSVEGGLTEGRMGVFGTAGTGAGAFRGEVTPGWLADVPAGPEFAGMPWLTAAGTTGETGASPVKNPEMSRIRNVGLDANVLIEPLFVGMMPRFEVMLPSEFSVEALGWGTPCGHKVRNPSGPGGTTVAFSA